MDQPSNGIMVTLVSEKKVLPNSRTRLGFGELFNERYPHLQREGCCQRRQLVDSLIHKDGNYRIDLKYNQIV